MSTITSRRRKTASTEVLDSETSTDQTRQPRRVRRRSRRTQRPEGEEIDLKIVDDPKAREYNKRNYYTKIITGALFGVITGVLFAIDGLLGFGLMQIFWILFIAGGLVISILIYRLVYQINAEQYSNRRLILSGTMSLIFMWVLTMVLTWSFLAWFLNGLQPLAVW